MKVLNLVRHRVLNSCRIWSPTGRNTPPPHPLPATHCLYILYFDTRKGGRGGRVEPEATVHKAGSKIPA